MTDLTMYTVVPLLVLAGVEEKAIKSSGVSAAVAAWCGGGGEW